MANTARICFGLEAVKVHVAKHKLEVWNQTRGPTKRIKTMMNNNITMHGFISTQISTQLKFCDGVT